VPSFFKSLRRAFNWTCASLRASRMRSTRSWCVREADLAGVTGAGASEDIRGRRGRSLCAVAGRLRAAGATLKGMAAAWRGVVYANQQCGAAVWRLGMLWRYVGM